MTKMMLLISMMTPTMNHPMSMGTMLMTQTILISMTMTKLTNSSWFSYILFITTVGGLMIMFMYMSSIASNEKFKPTKMKIIIMIMVIMMIISINEDKSTLITQNMEMNKTLMNQMEELKSTSKFFNLNKMNTTMIMMIMLLITMISVTNMSSSFEGPLKKTYVQIYS